MLTSFLAGLGLKEIAVLAIGVIVVVSLLKKLFKLAITLAFIVVLIHFGLPILQTAMSKM